MNKDLIFLSIVVFCVTLATTSLNPFFSSYLLSLNLSMYRISFLIGLASIIRIFFQPAFGNMLANKSMCLSIKTPIIILLLSTLVYSLSTNYTFLIFSRTLESIAICLFIIQVRVIINELYTDKKMLNINYYYAALKNCSSLIGPVIAGYIIYHLGFRSLCLCISILMSLMIVFIHCCDYGKKLDIDKDVKFKAFIKSVLKNDVAKKLLIIHFFEMFGFGLWISGWAVYAENILQWNSSYIGLSLSISALASIIIIPFMKDNSRNLFTMMIIGIFLLFIQSFSVLFLSFYNGFIWLSFFIGGMGGAIYFSSFHSYSSMVIKREFIPIYYGTVGSISYIGTLLGQSLTPFLWENFGYSSPITLDCLILIIVIFISIISNTMRKNSYEQYCEIEH